MLERVISGFQSGADISGVRAARGHGIPTSGYMTKGCKTEDGPRPRYIHEYGAVELDTEDYPSRTARNVQESDGTVWFGENDSRGFACTINACRRLRKPWLVVARGTKPRDLAAWCEEKGVRTLNVAGNRASAAPLGFERDVEAFLGRAFRAMGHKRLEG